MIYHWFLDTSLPIACLHVIITLLGCVALSVSRCVHSRLQATRVLLVSILAAPLLLSLVPEWNARAVGSGVSSTEAGFVQQTSPIPVPHERITQSGPRHSVSWAAILVGIWGVGVVAMATKLFADSFRLWRHLKSLPNLAGAAHKRIQDHLPDNSSVRILTDPTASAPYSFRFGRAFLVVPPDGIASNSPGIASCIVAHEWAHLRHYDSLDGLLWHLVRVLYWWNPFVYRLAGRVRELQEWRADAEATDSNLERAVNLSGALLRYSSADALPALAQPVTSTSKRLLKRRIERLVSTGQVMPCGYRARTTIGYLGLCLTGMFSLIGISGMMPAGEESQAAAVASDATTSDISIQVVFIEKKVRKAAVVAPNTRVMTPEEARAYIETASRDRKTTTVKYPPTVTKSGRAVNINSTINEPILQGHDHRTGAPLVGYLPIGAVVKIIPTMRKTGEIHCDASITISNIIGRETISGITYPIVSSRVYSAPLAVTPGHTISISSVDEAKSTKSKWNEQTTILLTPSLVASEK